MRSLAPFFLGSRALAWLLPARVSLSRVLDTAVFCTALYDICAVSILFIVEPVSPRLYRTVLMRLLCILLCGKVHSKLFSTFTPHSTSSSERSAELAASLFSVISPSRYPRGRERAREPVVAQNVEESDAWSGQAQHYFTGLV